MKWEEVHRLVLEALEQVPVGEALPTLRSFATRVRCSAEPVRRSLSECERLGLVRRRKGGGAIVLAHLPRVLDQHAANTREFSFSTSARREPHRLSTQVVECAVRLPRPGPEGAVERRAAAALGLKRTEPFLAIVRKRSLDGVPRVLHRSYLNPAHHPCDFQRRHDFGRDSLLKAIEASGYELLARRTVLRARLTTPEEERWLGVTTQPVLEAEQLLRGFERQSKRITIVEYLHATYLDWEYTIEHRTGNP
jgi:DNA-binding GntR family transcriptional regulator